MLAVESSSLSVSLAAAASTEARVGNVRFVQGDAERVSRGLVKEGRRFERAPRRSAPDRGPGDRALARDLGVRRLLYVACDAGALARDASGLIAAGFRLTTLQLVDMFPGTHHAETVAAFERAG